MQPERDRWRVSQRGVTPDRAISGGQGAAGQLHDDTAGGCTRAAQPSRDVPRSSDSQRPGPVQVAMGAALAKLRSCTEGGVPPITGPANRAYQDTLQTLHDALTQVPGTHWSAGRNSPSGLPSLTTRERVPYQWLYHTACEQAAPSRSMIRSLGRDNSLDRHRNVLT